MGEKQELSKDHPIRIAWDKYKESEEYRNSFKWAGFEEHRVGSMWAIYEQGYRDAKNDNTKI